MKTVYTAPNGAYTYSYVRASADKAGKLMIRMDRAMMRKWRAGAGKRLELLVDIFAQGGGWYEVTSKDSLYIDSLLGTKTDGLAVWLREFNRHQLGHTNYNEYPVQVRYVKRIKHSVAPNVSLNRKGVQNECLTA